MEEKSEKEDDAMPTAEPLAEKNEAPIEVDAEPQAAIPVPSELDETIKGLFLSFWSPHVP